MIVHYANLLYFVMQSEEEVHIDNKYHIFVFHADMRVRTARKRGWNATKHLLAHGPAYF